jgi:hypothetical protein
MEGRIPRPVLLAGLLGGAVGAVLCFALTRMFPPSVKPPPQTIPTAPPDARAFADDIIAKLKAGKDDELKPLVRLGFRTFTDEQFDQNVWGPIVGVRKLFAAQYGRSRGIELARENVVSDDIVRFTYVERFDHDCVVWSVVCYNTAQGWQIIGFQNLKLESAFEMLK